MVLKTYVIKSENIPPGMQRGNNCCFVCVFFSHYSLRKLVNSKRMEKQYTIPILIDRKLKILYDVISNSLSADYRYDLIFSNNQNKTAYDVLEEWYQSEKSKEE